MPSTATLGLYQKAASNYEKANKVYSDSVSAYENAVNSYRTAAQEYDDYVSAKQAEYETWKQSIREPESVKSELAEVDAQIEKLNRQKTAYSVNRTLAAQGRIPAGAVGEDPQWRIDALIQQRELLQEEYDWGKFYQYEELTNDPEFERKSQYRSTENGRNRSAMDIMMGNYTAADSGWDDPLYEFINGNEEAGAYISNQSAATAGNELGAFLARGAENKAEVRQMTPDEIQIFNYIYATRGKEEAHKYYEYLHSELNARQREAEERYWAEYAKEEPVRASLFSTAIAPMKGLSYAQQLTALMTDGEIDQNAA